MSDNLSETTRFICNVLRSAGEACTRIADETVAIRWYKKHLCLKKYKGVVRDKWGEKNKGFIDKTSSI